jgi:hypothetical protein
MPVGAAGACGIAARPAGNTTAAIGFPPSTNSKPVTMVASSGEGAFAYRAPQPDTPALQGQSFQEAAVSRANASNGRGACPSRLSIRASASGVAISPCRWKCSYMRRKSNTSQSGM